MTTLLKQSAGIEESYDALNIIKAKGERDGWTEEQFGLNQIDFSCLPCVPRNEAYMTKFWGCVQPPAEAQEGV